LEIVQAQEKTFEHPATHHLLQGFIENLQQMLQLVNQLLEDFQLEETGLTLLKEAINPHDLISECFSTLSVLADCKAIQLVNTIPEIGFSLLIDPVQIKRVITNLISNAISHIPEGALIEVSADEHDGDMLDIQIRDNGPGLPSAILPHLFERYYSGMPGIQKIGCGLGLSICKSIVTLHEGTITVENKPAQGACFHIVLPGRIDPKQTSSL
jgi:two-component system sensor histidine kinase KdpD